MKKVTKRIISLFLALMMMAMAFGIEAFAATATTVRQYKVYTSLGDSIAAGYSTPDYTNHADRILSKRRIEGSYPALLADDVLAVKFYPYAQPGFRTAELRLLLDETGNYKGDELTDTILPMQTDNFSNLKSVSAQRTEYIKAVKEADLITLDIGLNDTQFPMVAAALEVEKDLPFDPHYESEIADIAKQLGSVGKLMEYAYACIKVPLSTPRYAIAIAKALNLVFVEFKNNYDAIVKSIYSLNPDVTVVAVGTYNPFGGWTAGGIDIGKLFQPLYDNMNKTKKSYCSTYGKQYLYVDTSDVEKITNSTPPLDAGGFDPHPTLAGHQYIEKQILTALPEGYRPPKTPVSTLPALKKINGVWGVYDSNNKLRTSYTGLAKTTNKTYYVKNGKLYKATGVVSYDG